MWTEKSNERFFHLHLTQSFHCTPYKGNRWEEEEGRGGGGGRREKAGEERVGDMVWLPLIWLLSILPSCILPMMETYKTVTTKITKADESTNNHHRDKTHTQWEPKNHKQGDRKMTFITTSLRQSHRKACDM